MQEQATGLVFLSGGSALNPLATSLAKSGLRATHIIAVFDNGGSSRWLREAFRCIAVGDIRNRLTALSVRGSASRPALELFKRRLEDEKPQALLRQKVEAIARERTSLLEGISAQHRLEISAAMSAFLERVPANFDWRRGSIGNFVLMGRYFVENCDWEKALKWAHSVLRCVGTVLPVTTISAHLAAELANGRIIVGQQKLTDQGRSIEQPIKTIRLLKSERNFVDSITAHPYPPAVAALTAASAIVYSWGSFYTSVLPNLLVEGMADVILSRDIPRVLLLNPLRDAELLGMTPYDVVQTLERYTAQRSSGPHRKAVTHAIAFRPAIETKDSFYDSESLRRVESMGIRVLVVDGDGLPEEPQIAKIIASLLELAGRP